MKSKQKDPPKWKTLLAWTCLAALVYVLMMWAEARADEPPPDVHVPIQVAGMSPIVFPGKTYGKHAGSAEKRPGSAKKPTYWAGKPGEKEACPPESHSFQCPQPNPVTPGVNRGE